MSKWDEVHTGHDLPTNRKTGQVPICWGAEEDAAVKRPHELFRWFGGGWHVNADLDELAASVQPLLDAGFTDVAFVQIGDESQEQFLAGIAPDLLRRVGALR